MTDSPYAVRTQVGSGVTLASVEKPTARNHLMRWVLIGYFVVLGLSLVLPFVAALWFTNDQLAQFREVMQQTSGLSQGLFGILGVVVGYYFKEGAPPPEG